MAIAPLLEQRRTAFAAWFAVVVFAYYYKAAFCGFLGDTLGFDALCGTWIRGIDTNHWFEIAIYCPLLWLALHQVNTDIFGDIPLDPDARKRHRRRQLLGEFAIALVIYGTGIHIANVIEIYSRERQGVDSGEVYDLVYFLDEGLSHYVQFVPLFFALGWFVVNDRLPRAEHATLALFFGVGHGVERAVGIIEGAKWYLGLPMAVWIALTLVIRARRLRAANAPLRGDFFMRYGASFCIALPVAQAAYLARFGSFPQPSGLHDHESAWLAAGTIALTLAGTWVLLAGERWYERRRSAPAARRGGPG